MWGDEDVLVIEIAHDDAETMQGGEGGMELLEEGENGRCRQSVLLPESSFGQVLDGNGVGWQQRHLKAEKVAPRICYKALWG